MVTEPDLVGFLGFVDISSSGTHVVGMCPRLPLRLSIQHQELRPSVSKAIAVRMALYCGRNCPETFEDTGRDHDTEYRGLWH